MVDTNNSARSPGKIVPTILMPLPDLDFDPTEAAIPWKVCIERGWQVEFSTEIGDVAQADPHKLEGPLPGLLSAGAKAREAYQRMMQDPGYQQPTSYDEIDPDRYQAILLPGGDAPGMRHYLDSPILQEKVLQFWKQGKLIGAICHGVLVAARTLDPQTGHSILYGHQVTALPRWLDRFGYLLDAWLIKRGYIMGSQCVAEEVRACLERREDFSAGPGILVPYVVVDGNLITSRWYMEAEVYAERFADELQRRQHKAHPGRAG